MFQAAACVGVHASDSIGMRPLCLSALFVDCILQVLRLLGLPEADYNVITKDKNAARIHVSFMGKIFLPEALRERIADTKWTQVVAFRPTGQQLTPPA